MRTAVRWIAEVVSGVIILSLVLYVSVLRSSYYQPYYEERSKVGANWRKNGFTVAVVWPPHQDKSFVHGFKVALDELDEEKGPLSGKIHAKYYEEGWDSTGRTGAAIAQKVVRDRNVVAVLGHEFSASAIPASLTYEMHGILFLTPKSTEPRLTTHNFLYTFRLTPNDHEIAAAMVEFAKRKGWNKIGVFYARSPAGESLAPQITAQTVNKGVEVDFLRSYLARDEDWEEQDFRPMIAEIRKDQFNAVMIADQLPRAAKLVMDLRKMGMDKPIIANDKLDSGLLWDIAHQAANNVYVASTVDPSATTPRFQEFRQRFRKRWGEDPGYGASQGYEALMLLAEAGRDSDSADPLVVATTLRAYTWKGLFGDYEFSQNGDIEGRRITIKELKDGQFTTVPF
jgi:ABC-type branched-subunit amino acid transport system substrate-binding protein